MIGRILFNVLEEMEKNWMPTPTPTNDATNPYTLRRLLRLDAALLETMLEAYTGEGSPDTLTSEDLDRLDRQLRRVLLRVSHLAEAREERR